MSKQQSLKARKIAQQSRSKETVQRILQTAARILAEQGLQSFNTNAVAEAAEISIGSLYQYFPNTDAILATLIREQTEAFLAALKAAVAPPNHSFEQSVKELIRVAVTQQLSHPQLAALLDSEAARLPLVAETQATQSEILSILTQLLAEAGYANVHSVAQDVLAMARGMIDTAGALEHPDASALENRVYQAISGYLHNCTSTSQPQENL
jgi:AcrR family transcriptional regulator